MIVLTAATNQEIAGIRRRLGRMQTMAMDGYGLWQATFKDKKVLIVQTGIGRSRAEGAIASVLESHPATALVSFGFGGALTPELSAGDIVLCANTYCRDGGAEPRGGPSHADEQLLLRAAAALEKSGLNWRRGTGITISEPAQAEDKMGLSDGCRAEVCEMEDYWLAQAAGRRQIPFLAVRVIYDNLATSLPDVKRLVDDRGNLRPGRALAYLLAHPGYLVRVPGFYRDSSRARESLGTFVERFLEIA